MSRTVTKEKLNQIIRSVHYFNAGQAVLSQPNAAPVTEQDQIELGLVTVCILILKNGFKVEGVDACVDPSKYNQEIGQECAYENAFEKLWPLEGYLLKEQMWLDDAGIN